VKLARIEEVTSRFPDRVFAFDEFGPLTIRPHAGAAWAPSGQAGSVRSGCLGNHFPENLLGCHFRTALWMGGVEPVGQYSRHERLDIVWSDIATAQTRGVRLSECRQAH